MDITDVKAPDPVAGLPPWRDPEWVAAADAWITAACSRHGLRLAGPAEARCRPYSVVARVPVRAAGPGGAAAVWFKASPPASQYEPALVAALAGWYPGQFTTPLAVDAGRGWSLTPDGGPTVRQQAVRPGDLRAWHDMLRGYARLQFGLAARCAELLALGLADLRPDQVPDRFAALLADPVTERAAAAPGGPGGARLDALQALEPRLRGWCAELAALGIPSSLDHADLHPNNVFAAACTPFDWGDAVVGHPFGSLWVTRRTAGRHAGLSAQSPELAALSETYVAPWLEAGHARAAVDRSLVLAMRIEPVARALAWGRVFGCFHGHLGPAGDALEALEALLPADPPLGGRS